MGLALTGEQAGRDTPGPTRPRPYTRTPEMSVSEPSRSPAGLILVWVAWVLAACASALLVWDGSPTTSKVDITLVASVLAALGLLGARTMAGPDRLSSSLADLKLGPWIGIGFAVGFGAATLSWLWEPEGLQKLIDPSALPFAAVVSGLGFIALTVGHRAAPWLLRKAGMVLGSAVRGPGEFAQRPMSAVVLWVAALAAQAVSFARGSLGYLSDPAAALATTSSISAVLSALGYLGVLATLLAARRFAATRTVRSLAVLLLLALSQMAIGVFSGMKEAAIVHMVAFIIGYSARGRLRLAPMLVVAATAVLVVTPVVTALRAEVLAGSGRLSPAEAARELDLSTLVAGVPTQDDGSLRQMIRRLSRIGDVTVIVSKTPSSIAYAPAGDLFLGPVLGFIPRSVWPTKPVLAAGYEVLQEYYGMPASVYSSVAVTPYGDLYRRGGVHVVIAGMLVLGLLVRALDSRDGGSPRDDPRLLFLPMLLFLAVVKQEIDYVSFFAAIPSTLLIAALASRLVSAPISRSGERISGERRGA